jgi:large subunit ribosomal protein L33
MAKAQKQTTYLISSAGTGYFYISRRNKKKIKGENKLSKKKYDPIARQYVLFEEKKLSALKKKYRPGAAVQAAAVEKTAKEKPARVAKAKE